MLLSLNAWTYEVETIFNAPFLSKCWHSMHRAVWQSLSLHAKNNLRFQTIVYVHKLYCSSYNKNSKKQSINYIPTLFLKWLVFPINEQYFQIYPLSRQAAQALYTKTVLDTCWKFQSIASVFGSRNALRCSRVRNIFTWKIWSILSTTVVKQC